MVIFYTIFVLGGAALSSRAKLCGSLRVITPAAGEDPPVRTCAVLKVPCTKRPGMNVYSRPSIYVIGTSSTTSDCS